MDRQAGARLSAAGRCDLDATGAGAEQSPEAACRAVAEHCSWPAGKDGGELPTAQRESGMSDRIDAAVQAVKTLIVRPSLNRGVPEPKVGELCVGDHAVLARCERHEGDIQPRPWPVLRSVCALGTGHTSKGGAARVAAGLRV
jgi:hypothetical protein